MSNYLPWKLNEILQEIEVIHKNMKVLAILLVITLFVSVVTALFTLILLLT